jgi:hypothetical protein
MAIRILSNGIQIGNYTLQETRDGLLFNGTVVAKTYYQVKNFQGSVEGHVTGGSQGTPSPGTTLTTVEKFPFATTTVVGASVFTLTNSIESHSGHHSDTHAYMVAGRSFSPPVPGYNYTTAIRKYPFAIPSAGVETNVGVLFAYIPSTPQRAYHSGHSSSNWGFISGGVNGAPLVATNLIERFPFAYDNSSEVTGNLTQSGMGAAALNSNTHGYNAGRATNVPGGGVFSQTIDKFPFIGENNSTIVGNLLFARAWSNGGASSQISGYITGGGTPPLAITSNIQKFSFANETTQTSVGVLTQARWGVTNHSSITDAYTSGGNLLPVGTVSPGQTTTIDKFSFGNDMDASAVGALTNARFMAGGHHY